MEEALRRYQIIAPLLEEGLAECEKRHIRLLIRDQEGISGRTLRRYMTTFKEHGFDGLLPRERKDKGSCNAITTEALKLAAKLRQELPSRSAERIQHILAREGYIVARSTLERHLRLQGLSGRVLENQSKPLTQIEPTRWMLQILQNAYSFSDIKNELGEIKELKTLLQKATLGQLRERNQAVSILFQVAFKMRLIML